MSLPKLLCVLSICVVHALAQTRLPCGSGQWRDIFGQCQRFTISAGGGGSRGLQPFVPCGNGNWRNINGRCEKFTIGANPGEQKLKRSLNWDQSARCGDGHRRDMFTDKCRRRYRGANAGEPRLKRSLGGQSASCGDGHWRNMFTGECRPIAITGDQSRPTTGRYRIGANPGEPRPDRSSFQRAPCGTGNWRDMFGQCRRFTITADQSRPGLQPYQPCGRGNWRNVNGQCQRFTIGAASAPMQDVSGAS